LGLNSQLLTDNSALADWHYLPVFWTRWNVNHNYAKERLKELESILKTGILDPMKTFTVCQYDDGPIVKIRGMRVFLASRKSNTGEDIPLLSSKHKLPIFSPRKEYLASFMGRLSTHPIRQKMAEKLSGINDIYINDGDIGSNKFVNTVLSSYIVLCPRGYGGSSFRFYETMQLGVVPMLIGNIDTRPFKKYINWDDCSIFVKNPSNIPKILKKYSKEQLIMMGESAKSVWIENLSYLKWCKYVLEELQ